VERKFWSTFFENNEKILRRSIIFSTYKNRKHPFLGTLGPLDSAEDFQSKQKTNIL
jgi:hypothetical protein